MPTWLLFWSEPVCGRTLLRDSYLDYQVFGVFFTILHSYVVCMESSWSKRSKRRFTDLFLWKSKIIFSNTVNIGIAAITNFKYGLMLLRLNFSRLYANFRGHPYFWYFILASHSVLYIHKRLRKTRTCFLLLWFLLNLYLDHVSANVFEYIV